MIKAIYSCKLYKASSRKDRIQAALAASGNMALVTQLAESLDEEYKTPENLGKAAPKADSKPEDADNLFVDEDIDPEKDLMTVDDLAGSLHSSGGSHHSTPSPSSAPSKPEGGEGEPKPDTDTSDLMPESPANEKPAEPKAEPAEASTKIESAKALDLAVLKGSLNNVKETAGVARVAEKENEVWIYYNDDVNLNNIMTDVIESIANMGYTYLEFNRLARSDNAIVFQSIRSSESVVDVGQFPEGYVVK